VAAGFFNPEGEGSLTCHVKRPRGVRNFNLGPVVVGLEVCPLTAPVEWAILPSDQMGAALTRQLELSWFLDFNPIHGCIFCFFLFNLGLTSPVKVLFPPENSHSTMIHGVFFDTLKACQLPLKIGYCILNLLWGLDWGLLL